MATAHRWGPWTATYVRTGPPRSMGRVHDRQQSPYPGLSSIASSPTESGAGPAVKSDGCRRTSLGPGERQARWAGTDRSRATETTPSVATHRQPLQIEVSHRIDDRSSLLGWCYCGGSSSWAHIAKNERSGATSAIAVGNSSSRKRSRVRIITTSTPLSKPRSTSLARSTSVSIPKRWASA